MNFWIFRKKGGIFLVFFENGKNGEKWGFLGVFLGGILGGFFREKGRGLMGISTFGIWKK